MNRMNVNKLPAHARNAQSQQDQTEAILYAKLRAQGYSMEALHRMMRSGSIYCLSSSTETVN